ncbi:MAG: PKD domain-containing protein [Candidatus Thermoplasmatota archaeon]|nr:PKD domain-containing protein [Candidatus Thermoplasmatota archaeon]
MKHSKLWLVTMIVGSLFLIATCSVQAADVTITDVIEDVSSVDYLTQDTTVVTSHPDINVHNIDIVKATYTQQGTSATVTLQVRGNIEDRGKIIDLYDENFFGALNFVEYDFQVITSEQDYTISYANKTGQINTGFESKNLTASDFTVVGDTLTITFTLASATEVYEEMSVTSMYIKMNFTSEEDMDLSGFVYLSDIAPNPTLEIMEAYAEVNVAAVGDTVQFNGSVMPLTGQPPYQYSWDFGDGESSTQLNPTHAYTKAGEYTYNFTITDQAGDTASETGTITISSEGGSNGSGLSNTMILFLAILAIIIIVGVVVIVWIIRR